MTILHLTEDQLKVTPSAQRGLSLSWARKIGASFDINKCGTIMVAPKDADGLFPVLDGYHRVSGARIAHYKGTFVCFVRADATDEQKQAEAFLAFNDQKPVSNVDKFKVRVTAKDPVACTIQRELTTRGLVMGTDIHCVTELEKIARRSEEQLSRTLKIVTAAWGNRSKSTNTVPIRAVARLVNERTFDQTHLIEKMKSIEPVALIAKAEAGRELLGQSKDIAAVNQLVQLYNNRRRGDRLEEFTNAG